MGRVLGVDLGERRIGLALSDPLGITASPLGMIERSGDAAADRRAIVDAARDAGADKIVVGLPLAMSGKVGRAAQAALDEVEQLRAVAGPELPIETFDERLTTVIAQRALLEGNVRRASRKRLVDKVAAAVLLQSYLEGRSG